MGTEEPRVTRVEFPGSQSARLSGVLHEPAGADGAETVVITHCFTCSKDYKVIVAIAKLLASRGARVLRFDFAGTGASTGDFASTSLASNLSDLASAGQWLAEKGYSASHLVGHSLGGIACILSARLMPEVRTVAVVAAPSSATHLLETIPEIDPQLAVRDSVHVEIGGRQIAITRDFVEDLKSHSVKETLAGLGRPFLVVHGTEDRTVPVAEGEELFASARQPKGFLPVIGADHLFSNPEHAQQAAEAIALWVGV